MRKFSELRAEMQNGKNINDFTQEDQEILAGGDCGKFDLWHVGPGECNCSWYCGGGPSDIKASSTLAQQGGNTYEAKNAHNFSAKTAWIEGAKGYGVGEYIEYMFKKESPPITKIIIYNGYQKSLKTWKENSRVKQIKMYANGKPEYIFELQDTMAEQRFSIDSHQGSAQDLGLRFEIMDVYKGSKYDDTAISEIIFDGIHSH